MAKKKYYVVRKGKTPGIYLTWEDCQGQIQGYPGAQYKGFATIGEAEQYLLGGEDSSGESGREGRQAGKPGREYMREVSPGGETADAPETREGEAIAYVDGSYQKQTGEYSCGVVFFFQGEVSELSIKGEDQDLAAMHNVAGEVLGARTAMQEAVRRGVDKLTIVHDYQGIASWCLGEWKANKKGTIAYKAYYDSIKNLLDIKFQKVKGHSGDYWNDRADCLARQALSD